MGNEDLWWDNTEEEHDFFESREEAERLGILGNIIGATIVTLCIALIAGLFLGLLTLDAFNLKITERSSLVEVERKYAAALYPIVKDRHLLLVTLLLLEAVAYESLPLFLDRVVPTWMAIIISTTLVALFGEIIPSAVFTGPNQLEIAYRLVPLVEVLLKVMYPLAKPFAILLDYIVHGGQPDSSDEDSQEEYNRGELSALVSIQYEQRQQRQQRQQRSKRTTRTKAFDHTMTRRRKRRPVSSANWCAMKHEMLKTVNERIPSVDEAEHTPMEKELTAPMERQEVDVVLGAMQMKTNVATDIFTPCRHVYAIPHDLLLDRATITELYTQGYSRVPVYQHVKGRDEETNRSCMLGFLLVRQLMLVDWDHEQPVSTLPLIRPEAVSPRQNLVHLLNMLRRGGSHMAFVCARPDLANQALRCKRPLPVECGYLGIVTLEDVIESIIQGHIYDEVDIQDRDRRAVMAMSNCSALKLQSFTRKRTVPLCDPKICAATEETPLLGRGDERV